jgi:MarR family transcriptional regulator for hemolysin
VGNPLKLIGRANRAFGRVVDGPLREIGFAMSQVPVLVTLKKAGALSQAELARLLEVEQSSMAQLLNRMERDGLVERIADPGDRRSRLISLTDTAIQQLPRGKTVMEGASRRALTGFTKEEKDQLEMLLLRVNANLDVAMQEAEERGD